ncbi:probable nucleolar protein 5-2 [Aegilops tauschii subsp. strangulata]|uniref:probable nucleolar protein 5-2 n=1 Tax=Aegilops tauschii subsp. strangulata TaxID=200361 RepID=UPI003CC8BCBF
MEAAYVDVILLLAGSVMAVLLEEFRTFKDKSNAINKSTGVSKRLTEMIMNCRFPEQKIAVGKLEYKRIIEERLNIDCLYNTAVMEVMWGIQHCMPSLLPQEKSQLTEADCLPMSLGLHYVLQHYDCDVKTEMCDSVEKKYSGALRHAGDLIKDVSGINCEGWTLLKIATALKMIWWPEFGDSCEVSEDDVSRLVAHAYICDLHKKKDSCLTVYKDMVEAHEVKTSKKGLVKSLVELANETYEAEGPGKNWDTCIG